MTSLLIRDYLIFLAGILDILIGFFVFLKDYKQPRNRAFLFFTVSIGIWSISLACFFISKNLIYARFWILLVTASLITISTSFFLLSKAVTTKHFIQKKIVSLILFVALLLSAVAVFILPQFFIKEVISHYWGKESILGIGYYLYSLFYGLAVSISFYKLYRSFKNKTLSAKEKNINKFLFYSMIAAIGFGSIFDWLFPLLNYYKFIWVGPYSLFIVVFTMSYAITKKQLFNISVVIKKVPSYIITSIFIAPVFLLSAYYTHSDLQLLLVTMSVLGLVVAFIGKPLQEFLITTAKHIVTKGYYDAESLLKQIPKKVQHLKNREAIFEAIVMELDKAIQFEDISVLLAGRSQKEDSCLERYILKKQTAKGLVQDDSITVSPDSNFIAQIKDTYELLLFNKLESELQDEAKLLFDSNSKNVFLPFKSPELLEAVIVLGERSNGVALKTKDIDFFNALISIINVFLFRLTPYEIIQDEFERNKKKLFDIEKKAILSERISSMMNLIQEYNHEIRTPLQVILTNVERLKNKETSEFEDRKSKMLHAIDKISDIVGTTLRLSGESQWKRNEKAINITPFLNDIIKGYPFPESIKVMINASVPNNISILGDERDLPFIFNNLFKNACEAMTEGGTITVTTESNEDTIFIKVADTGIGIEEDKLNNIWNPFTSRHVTKGRGLGLSIAFRIVGEHSGNIEVESKVGKGSLFTVSLPIHKS